MYVQLENNINDLREMETALSLMVENEESIQYNCVKAGLAIAVQIQITPNQEPTWVRGVVRHVLHSVKLLKVCKNCTMSLSILLAIQKIRRITNYKTRS